MLNIPSKITESVACETLKKHLENVIQENQWGYRKGLSTESLLLYLTETWKANIDKGKVVGVIFTDFRKAFDCVDHEILGFKMQGCGISGNLLVWLKDYLNNRKHYVEINGKKSKLLIVEYGVPQGSLFGCRLFSIYVNDLASSITMGEMHLYADDTTAYVIGNSVEDVIELLNILFGEITERCSQNKMTLHPDKSEVIIIRKNTFIGPLLPVRSGNMIIKYTNTAKILGITVDNRIIWKQDVDKISKSFSAKIRVLKKLRFLKQKQLEQIYYKTIIPQVTYCISVWGNCSPAIFDNIEKQHIRAARIIKRIQKTVKDHEVLKLANWQNIAYIYKRRIASEVYKVVHSPASHRHQDLFKIVETRTKGKQLQIKRTNTELEKNSVFFRGPVVWNRLQREIREQKTLENFKKTLKKDINIIDKISFIKGTTTFNNQDLGNYVYF